MKKNRPQKVGITGGIGAGKSIVAKIFKTLNIPVYDADSRAKWLMNHNEKVQRQIIELFGEEAFQNGELNRTHLGKVAFSEPEKLQALNNIVHPAVGEDFARWFNDQDSKYVLKEAALLFESGSYKTLDRIITVSAPKDLRVERVLARDSHRTKEDIKKIISQQWDENEKIAKSDFIIRNDESTPVIPQVLEIHQKLTE